MTNEEYCKRICKQRPTKVQLDIIHKLEEIRNEGYQQGIEDCLKTMDAHDTPDILYPDCNLLNDRTECDYCYRYRHCLKGYIREMIVKLWKGEEE